MIRGSMDAAMGVARELRRLPGVRRIYESTDDARRIRRIARSGLIDTALYAAQLGADEVSVEDAAEHYVRWGHWAGLTINGLLDDRSLHRVLPDSGRPRIYDYLWTKAWGAQVSPLWDVEEYAAANPDALQHRAGPVGHLWERLQSDPSLAIPRRAEAGGGDVPWLELQRLQLSAFTAWAAADTLRRARKVSPRFHGVPDLGQWPEDREPPLVSIVLATWNRSGDLRRAADSVMSQTWAHWELLIVDDGSWDDTSIIASVLTGRDDRVRYLPGAHAGVSAARNRGIDAARGEFVTFLDSDNAWQPRFLEDMLIGMTERQSDVGYATIEIDNGDHKMFREASATEETLALGNVVDLNTLVVRRRALQSVGGFDTALRRAVDYDIILRLSARFSMDHVPILGAIYENRAEREDRISTTQPLGWNTAVRLKNTVDWEAARQRPLAAGAELIILAVAEDPWLDEKIAVAEDLARDADITVRVALIGPSPAEWLRARAAAERSPAVVPEMFADAEPYSFVVNTLLARAEREVFAVVDTSSRFDADSLRALVTAVRPDRRRIVAPLQLHPDGTVVSAGTAFPKPAAAPIDLLSRHPLEDAAVLGDRFDVPGLSGRTFAAPTTHLMAVDGLNPLLYNEYELPILCLALRERHGEYVATTRTDILHRRVALPVDFPRIDPTGSLSAVRAATATAEPTDLDSLYRPLGLTVSHFRAVKPQPSPGPRAEDVDVQTPPSAVIRRLHPVVVRQRRTVVVDGTTVPRLRWAIRIASPAFPTGGTWGDTHFARSLSKALESLGQEVVIDHHEVDVRPTAYLDDVTLVLRGLDRVEPVTGGVSILWVISHPEQVTHSEAARFDRVFAASTAWAREAEARWAIPVAPLLQCTDPESFAASQGDRRSDIVFVGKSRGVARPSVVYPVRAGIPVRVFGSEWDGILPAGTVEAEYVPNDQLGDLYGRAAVVLNDHWDDMRRDGFISNRLFDVVAAGGRVFSDRVEGIDEVFGRSVVQYDSPQQLVEMLQGDLDALFPDESELLARATVIREEHSFRARAVQLLDAVLDQLPPTSGGLALR